MEQLSFPLISVVVPCYNQGRFLKYALDSVNCQSYQNWECIIVNDGSTDETEDIAKTYIKKNFRFNYIKTDNLGLSAARNTGIKRAKGNFIQLLDSDDLIETHKLQEAVDFYLSDDFAESIIVYSSMRYFEDGYTDDLKLLGRDNFIAHIEIKKEDSIKSQKELLIARNPFVISAPVYPISLFMAIGYFDENLKALEDWDFHLRCINENFKFHHLYKKSSNTLIRLHNQSMMRDQKLLDENFFRFRLKHNLIKTEPVKKAPLIKKILLDMIPPVVVRLFNKII